MVGFNDFLQSGALIKLAWKQDSAHILCNKCFGIRLSDNVRTVL